MVPEARTSPSWAEKEGDCDSAPSWLQDEANERHDCDRCVSSSAESDSDYDDSQSLHSMAQPVVPFTQLLIPPLPPLPLTTATVVQQQPAPSPPAPVSTFDRPHICHHPGCNKAYYKLGKLNRHLATHSDTRLHCCPHSGCSRAFHRADHLHRHLLSHSNDRRYTCQQAGCGRAFLTSTHLRRHTKTHDCSYHCTVDGCGQSFNKHSRLTQHVVEQHNGQTAAAGHVCSYPPCTLSFTSRALLTKHIRLCHLPHRYTCVDCLASFARHLEWRRHRRQHDNELVPCPTCLQPILRKRLSHHQHSHTAAAAAACTSDPSGLSSTAQHACGVAGCERRFVSVSGLRAHERAVHRRESEGYECDECGREFGYRSVRDRHVVKMHGPGDGEGRKRRRSEKEKAFGRVGKRTRKDGEDEEGEEAEEELVAVVEAGQMDNCRVQTDGGERESERTAPLLAAHGAAVCVM